jgi:hypothetical protein
VEDADQKQDSLLYGEYKNTPYGDSEPMIIIGYSKDRKGSPYDNGKFNFYASRAYPIPTPPQGAMR